MIKNTLPKHNDFLQGGWYVFQAFKAYLHPRVRPYIYIPLLINFLIFGVLFYFGAHYVIQKLSFLSVKSWPSWLHWLEGFLSFIRWFLLSTVLIFFLGIMAMVSTLFANFVSAPFNGLLSETYAKVLGASLKQRPLLHTLRAAVLRELQKFLYYLPRAILVGLLALIFHFLPPLNLLTPVLLYWFGAWMMAIQYIDYPADNAQIPFRSLIKRLKERKTLHLGFGLAVCALSSIPFINFFVMPAAIIGATRLWYETPQAPPKQ